MASNIEIRRPTEAELPGLLTLDRRAFFLEPIDGLDELSEALVDRDRFWVGVDHESGSDSIVAIAGSYELELTLPGNATVPMSGVTWVAVAVTHRRQGLLRRLMRALDEAAVAAGEPVLGLGSSEGNLYGRFGYGIVNHERAVRIDSQQGRLIDPPPPGGIRLLDPADAMDDMVERWDRYRKATNGEVSRPRELFDVHYAVHSGATVALHDDGYAAWTHRDITSDGQHRLQLQVIDFCAATPEAYRALWHIVLSVDLAAEVSARRAVTTDDLLPSLLVNPRHLMTTTVRDNHWLKAIDPGRLFGARSYRIDGSLVLDMPVGIDGATATFEVTASTCRETDAPADFVLDAAAVGPLLMGGTSASALARAGTLVANNPDKLGLADAFFGWYPAPVNRCGY